MPLFRCKATRNEGGSQGDADQFWYTFELTPVDKVGKPDEPGARSERDVGVNISRTVVRGWNLVDDEAVRRAAFWYAVDEGLRKDKDRVTLRSENIPGACPYDLTKPTPTGYFEVEIPAQPIGFRA